MKKVLEPVTVIVSADDWNSVESVLSQLVETENPVTSSTLKGILAKRVARIWGHEEKFITDI